MNCNWVIPPGELSNVIQSINVFETYFCNDTYQLIMPNPTNGLIIQIGEPSYYSFDGINFTIFPKLYFALASISKQSMLLKCNGSYKSILVIFKPGVLYNTFKFPLSECIENPIVDAKYILPKGTYLSLLRITEDTTDKQDITGSVATIITQGCVSPTNASISRRATELLIAQEGKLSIVQLSKMVNTTPRTLERQFKYEQGTSPNSYARLVKHHAIIREIVASNQINWLDIIVKYNFHDKAHFIKDFKKITGYSPSSYLKHTHTLDIETRLKF
ncbi:MAG: AraC family transcriptional regulator [Bacteroidales bacterium]|nr:AraC family transcriptional regulator [Bacteroidales bacterium]MBN2750013.1 AraC family transcriptional regulator [Bacteroidales bacterium]